MRIDPQDCRDRSSKSLSVFGNEALSGGTGAGGLFGDPRAVDRRGFLLRAGAISAALPLGGGLLRAAEGMAKQPLRGESSEIPVEGWRIGNARVERVVRFSANAGLNTVSWRHKVTGVEFVTAAPRVPALEFEFDANGTRIDGTAESVRFLSASEGELSRGGRELRIRLRAKAAPVEITVHYAVYGEHPVVRKWLSIRNLGPGTVVLTRTCFEWAAIAPGPASQLQTFGGYGTTPGELFMTGRGADTTMVVRNAATREGLAVINEAPAFLKRTELNHLWSPQVRALFDTGLFPFEQSLAPGETFDTAACSVAFFVEDRGFADPRWSLSAYVAEVLSMRGPGFRPPWIYNTWMPFRSDVDHDLCASLIPVAAQMGIDIFSIDGGWQSKARGTNIDPEKFPQGFDPICAQIKQYGMDFGLWFGVAEIHRDSADAQAHPEWLCRDRHGNPLEVMCLATPYRDLVADHLIKLARRYDIKYFKLDLTTVFNTYGAQPGCFAEWHNHRTWAESLARMYEGLLHVAAKVHRQCPDTLLDYTFELWGERHLIDHALIQSVDLDWLSNVFDDTPESAGPRQCRALLYPRAYSLPPDAMLIGNPQAQVEPIAERYATAMGSAPLLLGDLRALTAAQVEEYGRALQWYKDLRGDVQLEAFFPLGAWQSPVATQWDGFARLSREGQGLLALFANESGARAATVRIPAFPDGAFRLVPFDDETAAMPVSAAQMREGVQIAFPAGATVRLLRLFRA